MRMSSQDAEIMRTSTMLMSGTVAIDGSGAIDQATGKTVSANDNIKTNILMTIRHKGGPESMSVKRIGSAGSDIKLAGY